MLTCVNCGKKISRIYSSKKHMRRRKGLVLKKKNDPKHAGTGIALTKNHRKFKEIA